MKFFGIISLLISAAIIALLVWGHFGGADTVENQIEAGQDAIQDAKDAAGQENQYNLNLQQDLQTQTDLNYKSIQNNLKNIK